MLRFPMTPIRSDAVPSAGDRVRTHPFVQTGEGSAARCSPASCSWPIGRWPGRLLVGLRPKKDGRTGYIVRIIPYSCSLTSQSAQSFLSAWYQDLPQRRPASMFRSAAFAGALLLAASIQTVQAVDKTRKPALDASLVTAATQLDRLALLPSNDDWIFDFTEQQPYFTFSPGCVTNMNAATFPAAKGNGMTSKLSFRYFEGRVLTALQWPC